jgi:hypothetical protein
MHVVFCAASPRSALWTFAGARAHSFHLSNAHETAISLFCSCAKVKPSGACRNSTISDCLKYRRASVCCQH